jgi:hypothetical protein
VFQSLHSVSKFNEPNLLGSSEAPLDLPFNEFKYRKINQFRLTVGDSPVNSLVETTSKWSLRRSEKTN